MSVLQTTKGSQGRLFRRRPVWRRSLWRMAWRTGAATFLIACFFLGGSFDRFIAPWRKSGFTLEDAAMGLGFGVLLLCLIGALVEASGGLFRRMRGMP